MKGGRKEGRKEGLPPIPAPKAEGGTATKGWPKNTRPATQTTDVNVKHLEGDKNCCEIPQRHNSWDTGLPNQCQNCDVMHSLETSAVDCIDPQKHLQ